MNEATLEPTEFHPMAPSALAYVRANITLLDVESMASCAIEGNRTADICLSTYNRLEKGEPVSDRYILGLAWFVKGLRDCDVHD